MGWDMIIGGGLALALALILVLAGVEDVRCREIGNGKVLAAALLAPGWWWVGGMSLWPGLPIQLGMAAVTFALFAAAFHHGAMGGGDVKLIAALSLWFPWPLFAQLLVAMSLAGGVVTAAMLVDRRLTGRPIEVPYGVAIAVAGLLTLREPILNQFA
jgi:prepilin peptidase CpaA